MIVLELEFGYASEPLTEAQLAYLAEQSLGTVDTTTDSDGRKRVAWGCYPLLPADKVAPVAPAHPMIRRAINLADALASFGHVRPAPVLNERVGVAVAGLGTLQLDEVIVRENLCTEQLQRELDAGWRVLAVCVQPDQRRPDYVLARQRRPDNRDADDGAR